MSTSIRQELLIYFEILHGKLQPTRSHLNDHDLLKKLIEYANTQKFSNEEIILNDYLEFGYRSIEDFIITKCNTNGIDYFTVIPNKYYLLGDKLDNDIKKPACFKSKSYLQLIMDEFERIKNRAFYLLNFITDLDNLKIIATKNLRTAEYLLRETSAYCHYLLTPGNDNQTQTLFYINDCLKKFLIKVIRFYHRLFNPFITEYYANSKKLINNIDQTTYSDCIKYIYQDPASANFENVNLLKDNFTPPYLKHPKIKWTLKINQLTTLFFDLYEKGYIELFNENDKKSQKVTQNSESSETNMLLVEFIHANFLDSNGHEFSKDTLRTYLNPNRPDKRSKKSQSININKYT